MNQAEWILLLLCAFAALLHGLSGFGFPMMSTAVLSTQYELSLAITLVILPCLLLNLMMLNADPERSFIQSTVDYSKRYWPLILSSLIGSLFGVQLLLWINEGYLKLLLGLVIVFYVMDQLRAKSIQVKPSSWNMIIFGLLAGIIGGATNAMAPFLMMYLLSCQLNKTDIVIITNLNFIISKLIQLLLLFPILIQIQSHQKIILVAITLFALVGVWLGNRMRQSLSQQHFKFLVLALLAVLGVFTLYQSATLLQHSPVLFLK
ncbi:hypothetical protein A3K93_01200 [Acinetobacter sp. NCu2D-2]|uniref:sulfite exporter TauE/SafE family protein n=1 Tax=Acinetobacter sp. NCu2D-2 TaxID=1608473 RepID=UPI0007CDDAEC|nr:sulfite exporter TauE/SafE family protein [Acinetobacter sp. NCu2D-2]ANF80937.1 hypothetical protein A3K93_01200 [Acinetobacter sp. NCu2D-2]